MEVNQILIVDDDEAMLKLLAAHVTAGGYRAITAKSGEDALNRLDTLSPDLIIADVLMPGMKGYEFCRKVREGKNDGIPFIFCSAMGDQTERVRGLRLGADDYIVKPVNPAELLLKIEKLIEKSKKLREMAKKIEEANNASIMSGSLDNLWTGDILQILSLLDIAHCCMTVSNSRNKTGEIYVQDKQLIHARTGNVTGMKAFCRILSWREGKYKVEVKKFESEPTLSGSLESQLMEGVKQLDEFLNLRDSIMKNIESVKIKTDPQFPLKKIGENSWVIFKIIGAKQDLESILDLSPFTDLETMQIISELHKSGAISIFQNIS